jgi:hypothetical protein
VGAIVRRHLLIALACIAMSLAACADGSVDTTRVGDEAAGGVDSEGEAAQSSRDNLDACFEIEREEVEAALGLKVSGPTRGAELVSRRAGTLTSSCTFGGDRGFVRINVRRPDPGAETSWSAAQTYQELKALVAREGGEEASDRVEEVAGLGADAFAETKTETVNHQTTELRVLSKRSILTLRVTGPASAPTLDAAKTLAAQALSGLERHEGMTAMPAPERRATPKAAAADGEKRPQGDEEKSRSERKGAKKDENPKRDKSPKRDERTAARRDSATGGRNVSRRAEETKSKASRNSAVKSKKETAKSKRETTKTTRTNPRVRKRS